MQGSRSAEAGFTTKVVFISTEDPNLNAGRILVRMSRGGQSVPLSTIPESYEESMKSLPEARRHADDLLVYDNTPNGRGHRLVARFIVGELVKTTHTSPEWLKNVFRSELRRDMEPHENLPASVRRRELFAVDLSVLGRGSPFGPRSYFNFSPAKSVRSVARKPEPPSW